MDFDCFCRSFGEIRLWWLRGWRGYSKKLLNHPPSFAVPNNWNKLIVFQFRRTFIFEQYDNRFIDIPIDFRGQTLQLEAQMSHCTLNDWILSIGLCVTWHQCHGRFSYDYSIDKSEWKRHHSYRTASALQYDGAHVPSNHFVARSSSNSADIGMAFLPCAPAYALLNCKLVEIPFHINCTTGKRHNTKR